jgi:signal transduction histidine kinase
VGAIGNYWARNRTPNTKEMQILKALANITALAMENVGLYDQLQGKIADLEQSNAELERFAWIASHDLKSPLRAVDNLAAWIEEEVADSAGETTRAHLATLRARTRRMEHMLDDLLEYAMIDESPAPQAPAMISGRMMLQEIESLLFIPEECRIEATPGFLAMQMPHMPLERVFLNLIGNAIKHHDSKLATIRLDARAQAGEVVFTVSDDGPGIPAPYRDKMFEMFQTLKPRDQTEGSGMGLAIVKKIVTSRGGDVSVHANEPRGCIFSFNWPSTLPFKGLPA